MLPVFCPYPWLYWWLYLAFKCVEALATDESCLQNVSVLLVFCLTVLLPKVGDER